MQKYSTSANANERTVQRLAAVSARWEETQIRIGRVTADVVLPTLEKALTLVEKIADFAERNPGAVKAALGIGGSLAVLGGIVATVAQVISTVASIQGLAASFGAAGIGAGGASAGAAGLAGAGAAGAAGLGASLTAVLTSPAVVGAFALAIGGVIGKFIGEALVGREVTWGEILTTLQQMAVIIAQGWDDIFGFFGGDTDFAGAVARAVGIPLRAKDDRDQARAAVTLQTLVANTASTNATINNTGQAQVNAIGGLGSSLADFFAGLFDGKAAGGYAPYGPYVLGDNQSGGRGMDEFILSGRTTRAAENIIGGKLTQDKVMSAVVNANFSNGLTMKTARKLIAQNNANLVSSLSGAF
jgi:hypothetical protein